MLWDIVHSSRDLSCLERSKRIAAPAEESNRSNAAGRLCLDRGSLFSAQKLVLQLSARTFPVVDYFAEQF